MAACLSFPGFECKDHLRVDLVDFPLKIYGPLHELTEGRDELRPVVLRELVKKIDSVGFVPHGFCLAGCHEHQRHRIDIHLRILFGVPAIQELEKAADFLPFVCGQTFPGFAG
jgi:hypothetical protein